MDKLKGGIADKIPTKAFDKKLLRKGMSVEKEHSTDPKVQKEIAKDHLAEDPKYYQKLEKIEKSASTEKTSKSDNVKISMPIGFVSGCQSVLKELK